MRNRCFVKTTAYFLHFALISLPLLNPAHAVDEDWHGESVSLGAVKFEILFRQAGGRERERQLGQNLMQSLKRIMEFPVFQKNLPEEVGLLVDGCWTKTSGYWSSALLSPRGNPSVLTTPDTAANVVRSQKLLAHELTHLTHHRLRPQEDAWVREGVAMLAEHAATGFHNSSLLAGFGTTATSLVRTKDAGAEEEHGAGVDAAQYGHVLQYFLYIRRLCGGEALFTRLLSSPSRKRGLEFVDEVLKAADSGSPVCAGFRESFIAFEKARFVNSPLTPESYVVPGLVRGAELSTEKTKLPPYSAAAYARGPETAACPRGEIPWGDRRCIRVRLE